ncbi:General secretion pathway protein D (plasmid) [Pseudomonas putida]|nr:General secretion pathway protein D [Pseudomonas putida]
MKSPESNQLAANVFQDAKNAAWGYGWGASETPHALLEDIPELLNAFYEGKSALQQDMKLAG